MPRRSCASANRRSLAPAAICSNARSARPVNSSNQATVSDFGSGHVSSSSAMPKTAANPTSSGALTFRAFFSILSTVCA